MTYYDREPRMGHAFSTADDIAKQAAVRRACERVWHCTMRPFGSYAPIDYYAERDNTLVAVVEIKCRDHPMGKHDTVWLNVRKWLALSLASVGLGVAPIYVVGFTDALCWVDVRTIDASRVQIAGCRRVVKSHSDIEPVIDIPIGQLRPLEGT